MRYRVLNRNREFSRCYARGKSYVHPKLVLYVLKKRSGGTRVGLTATKKVGNAVRRNRARRVMRAALQQVLPPEVGRYDLVFVARGQTAAAKSDEIAKAARQLLQRAGLLAEEPK